MEEDPHSLNPSPPALPHSPNPAPPVLLHDEYLRIFTNIYE